MIKRILLCILLLTSVSYADTEVVPIGQPVASANPCPSGTYAVGYDGDHTSGADYGCYESGTANEQGTTAAGTTVNSSYVEFDAINEYLRFAISGDISADIDSVGTLFFSWKQQTTGSDIKTNALIELLYSATEKIYCTTNDTNDRILCYHMGGAESGNVLVLSLDDDNTYRCGYSWDATANTHCIKCVTSGAVSFAAPDDEDAEAVDGFNDGGAVDPLTLAIGEDGSGIAVNTAVRVWDVFLVSGYKATDPGSL